MRFIDKYKVDYLDYKLFTSSWGVVNHQDKANHMEALINERYGEGYKLKEILSNVDPVGYHHLTFIFEKMEESNQ
jgi:hypothetical protein